MHIFTGIRLHTQKTIPLLQSLVMCQEQEFFPLDSSGFSDFSIAPLFVSSRVAITARRRRPRQGKRRKPLPGHCTVMNIVSKQSRPHAEVNWSTKKCEHIQKRNKDEVLRRYGRQAKILSKSSEFPLRRLSFADIKVCLFEAQNVAVKKKDANTLTNSGRKRNVKCF